MEDNQGDVELLKMSIERYCPALNIILDVAETVEEGKLRFQPKKHAAALIDCNLPDGEGTEVIEFIREKNKSFPVFFISGYFTDVSLRTAEKHNPTLCLEKNYNQNFIQQIRKYLS